MGQTIPRGLHATSHLIKAAFCIYGGERSVDEPPGSTHSSGTNSDSRRLAPERAARRGSAQGWAEQSRADFTLPRTSSKRRFAYPAESCDPRTASTPRLWRYAQPERLLTNGF